MKRAALEAYNAHTLHAAVLQCWIAFKIWMWQPGKVQVLPCSHRDIIRLFSTET